MGVYDWRALSWPEFRGLSSADLLAVLPLGALEAHGPHLPLGTDIVIAEAMARAGADRLSRRGFQVVLLPAVAVAPAPFASSFEGTIDASPAATTAIVSSLAQCVARNHGRATVIANAHHDPAHVRAIREAVEMVEREGSATLVFPDLTRRRWAEQLTDEFRSGACHAGRYESSAMLAAEPRLVKTDLLPTLAPNPRSLVDAIRRGDRTFEDAGGPQAYFGWPADATAEEGQAIIDRLGAILEEATLEALGTMDDERRTEARTPTSEREIESGAALRIVNPESLGRPRGFSHGIVVPAGWRPVFVAGQTAADREGVVAPGNFAGQFDAALGKVVEVVRAAGGDPSHVARLTVFVADLEAYRASRSVLGEIWSRHMGRHYPAMALVQVTGLVDPGATVEIQADAVVPPAERA